MAAKKRKRVKVDSKNLPKNLTGSDSSSDEEDSKNTRRKNPKRHIKKPSRYETWEDRIEEYEELSDSESDEDVKSRRTRHTKKPTQKYTTWNDIFKQGEKPYNDDTSEEETQHITIFQSCNRNDDEEKVKSFRERINSSNLPENAKTTALNFLKSSDSSTKQTEWLEALLSIPYGKYAISPVTRTDSQERLLDFFKSISENLNRKVYGLESVKQEIFDYLSQSITSENTCAKRVLALYGNPGVGKSYIVRSAFADVLNCPLSCINMGGLKDSSCISGFEYTYLGSKYGAIVQSLIEKKVMNPIILCEEIDKISNTNDGIDIQKILMLLTDPEANFSFRDKYFPGIDIDLSKVMFIFTLNDPALLDPILHNRLHMVNIPDPTFKDKINIAQAILLPKLFANIGLDKSSVFITDDTIAYVIKEYCADDKGLRKLKDCLETLLLRLNTIKLIGADISGKLEINFPLHLNKKLINLILQKPKPEIFNHMYM